MWNGVGGSTVHWEGHFPRLHPSDFPRAPPRRRRRRLANRLRRSRTLLRPQRLQRRRLGCHRLSGQPAAIAARDASPAARPFGSGSGARLRDARLALVAVGQRHPLARPRRPAWLRQPRPLQLRLRTPGQGTADVTYWPKALRAAPNSYACARQGDHRCPGWPRARGLDFDAKGAVHEQLARLVVVCCNGIGTPRLLLASKSRLYPDGLANGAGMVGTALDEPSEPLRRGRLRRAVRGRHLRVDPLFSQHFYETDNARGFVRGYSLVVYRPGGPASVAGATPNPCHGARGITTRCGGVSAHSARFRGDGRRSPRGRQPRRARRRGDRLERRAGAARHLSGVRQHQGAPAARCDMPPGRCSRPPAHGRSSTTAAS